MDKSILNRGDHVTNYIEARVVIAGIEPQTSACKGGGLTIRPWVLEPVEDMGYRYWDGPGASTSRARITAEQYRPSISVTDELVNYFREFSP
jgi:hypothetical protein